MKKFNIYRVSAVTPELRIANPNFNAEVICNVLNKNKSDLFVFPELSISGYSCMDLFFQNTLLENCYKAVDKIVKESRKIKSLIVIGSPVHSANKLFNAALVIAGGKILGAVPKTYLCNSNE
ncbi:MAG: nitrilase-related carbon-nitrogen hydrolase [Candidatus Kapabacteria bacterium]|nr:nitrilase-related carbon-nitrogen hydrolase [Candidatus Kapabacteria bacterium]